MPDDLRRPVERGDRDVGSAPMIIDHIWRAVAFSFVRNDADMPEVASRELFEDDDITRLPLGEILLVSSDHLIREIFCFSREEDIEIFHTPEVDICVRFCRINTRILQDILIHESPEARLGHIKGSRDDVRADSRVCWRIPIGASIISIREIIRFHDSDLFFRLCEKRLCLRARCI